MTRLDVSAFATRQAGVNIKERLGKRIQLTLNLTAIVTAHGKTKDYLHRFKIIDSSECTCGGVNQTVDHLIYECPKLQREREVLVRNIVKQETWPRDLIFVVPCIMLNSEINPTRCNNCVYSSQWLYSRGTARHNKTVITYNSTRPTTIRLPWYWQNYNISVPAYLRPYTAYVLLMMGGIVTRNM